MNTHTANCGHTHCEQWAAIFLWRLGRDWGFGVCSRTPHSFPASRIL